MQIPSGKTYVRGAQTTVASLTLALAGACGGGPVDAPAGHDERPPGIATHTSALGVAGPLLGVINTEPGPDFNRCVPNVANLLQRLNPRGDIQALHYSAAGYTNTDGSKWHSQGIVRLPFYWWDSLLRGQFFVSTFSHPIGSGPDDGAHLAVGAMDFMGGNDGRAIGSNKTFNDGYNGSDWLVAPNPADTFLQLYDPAIGQITPKFKLDPVQSNPAQNHPGGVQTFGWHVAVAMQQFEYYGLFDRPRIPAGSRPIVKFVNLWEPQSPLVTSFMGGNENSPPDGTGNDATAIMKLQDGRFLLAMEKGGSVSQVHFWISKTADIDTPGTFGADGRAPDATWTGYPGWSAMNLLSECYTGNLFMLGFRRNGSADRIDLMSVTASQGGTPTAPTFSVSMTQLPGAQGAKNVFCSDNKNQRHCTFESSAGSYIEPDGRVIIYSQTYGNDGCLYNPQTAGTICSQSSTVRGPPYLVHGNANPTYRSDMASTGYVRQMEFREHGDPAATCPTLDQAWIEFYSNANLNRAAGDSGTWYRLDWKTWNERPSYSLGPNWFNDVATSVRWCLPTGSSIGLYKGVNWANPAHFLNGTGRARQITDLNTRTYSYGGSNMNDSISSYYWWGNSSDPRGEIGDDPT
jgi:hypothetical protein